MNNNRNNSSNNNNSNNNRRRGRGNRSPGGGGGGSGGGGSSGGGSQGNRIDSRARGNAPQMLDKYKKLAQDAQHHGDRVQAEYYLQFADHYFRVIADNRVRQDEPRGGRRDERDQDDFDIEADDEVNEPPRFEPRDRETRERDNRERDNRERENRERDNSDTREREPRRERPRRDAPRDDQPGEAAAAEETEGVTFAPDENPFTRDAREPSLDRPKRREPRARRPVVSKETEFDPGFDSGFDAAVLPPSISANDGGDVGAIDTADEPAPRRRRKRGEGGTLSAVG